MLQGLQACSTISEHLHPHRSDPVALLSSMLPGHPIDPYISANTWGLDQILPMTFWVELKIELFTTQEPLVLSILMTIFGQFEGSTMDPILFVAGLMIRSR